MKMTPRAWFLALIIAFAPRALPAADTPPGWDTQAHALLGAQAPADVEELKPIVANTDALAEALARYAVDNKVTSAAILRLRDAGTKTWFLYRTGDKAMVAELTIDKGRVFPYHTLGEVPLAEYDRLFKKLRDYRQGKPTPLTRNKTYWSHRYGAVTHVHDKGASTTYLMSAHDILAVEDPGAISDLVCGTLLSGMHCRPGPRESHGWVIKELNALMKTSMNKRSVLNLLCDGGKADGACDRPGKG